MNISLAAAINRVQTQVAGQVCPIYRVVRSVAERRTKFNFFSAVSATLLTTSSLSQDVLHWATFRLRETTCTVSQRRNVVHTKEDRMTFIVHFVFVQFLTDRRKIDEGRKIITFLIHGLSFRRLESTVLICWLTQRVLSKLHSYSRFWNDYTLLTLYRLLRRYHQSAMAHQLQFREKQSCKT